MSSGRVGDRIAIQAGTARRRDPMPGPGSPVYPRGSRGSLSPAYRRSSRRRHEEEGSRRRGRTRSRSNSPRRRRRPGSCRSRTRTRSYECENRQCCHTRSSPHSDDREDNDEQEGSWYQPPADNEFTVRIGGFGAKEGIFQCDGCFAMLSSPVYECANGDVICDRCSYDDDDDCEECGKCGSTELTRSRAVSHLLRCIRFACKNHKYGCPSFLPRQDMDDLELSCDHEPCFCPIRRCGFSGAADYGARPDRATRLGPPPRRVRGGGGGARPVADHPPSRRREDLPPQLHAGARRHRDVHDVHPPRPRRRRRGVHLRGEDGVPAAADAGGGGEHVAAVRDEGCGPGQGDGAR